MLLVPRFFYVLCHLFNLYFLLDILELNDDDLTRKIWSDLQKSDLKKYTFFLKK